MRRLFLLPWLLAVGCLGLPKVPEPESLSLAADCLDRDDAAGAIPHLSDHLERTPDQPAIRALLAAQYARTRKWDEAKIEYQLAIEEYGDDPTVHRDALIQCHTKLVTIAGELNDETLESRSRAAALALIAEKLGADDLSVTHEAIEALRLVCEKDRDDAVAHVYLGDCLTRVGQTSAARVAYAAAANALPGALPDSLRARLPTR